nr:hypothetical protein [Tanacetum cinerariifolium]
VVHRKEKLRMKGRLSIEAIIKYYLIQIYYFTKVPLIADLSRDSLDFFIEVLKMPRNAESNNSNSLQSSYHSIYLQRVAESLVLLLSSGADWRCKKQIARTYWERVCDLPGYKDLGDCSGRVTATNNTMAQNPNSLPGKHVCPADRGDNSFSYY